MKLVTYHSPVLCLSVMSFSVTPTNKASMRLVCSNELKESERPECARTRSKNIGQTNTIWRRA